jgi:hypothetical protein
MSGVVNNPRRYVLVRGRLGRNRDVAETLHFTRNPVSLSMFNSLTALLSP